MRPAYFNRGWAYGRKRDYDKAIADYGEVIRLNPKNVKARCDRACAYLDKDENDKAIADYDEAIRLDPKCGLAYYSRGYAYGKKGDYDKAIANYNEAIRLDPKNAHRLSTTVAWPINTRATKARRKLTSPRPRDFSPSGKRSKMWFDKTEGERRAAGRE